MRPRFGGLPPAPSLPATERPDDALAIGTTDGAPPTGTSGDAPATGKGKAPEPRPSRWFPYTRTTESRAEPLRYEVADTGHLRLPAGQEIPPTGWTRFGDDFVHPGTGALLRGDSGWLGRVANLDTLVPALTALDPDAAPYRITADPSSLHLIPEYGVPEYGDGTALRIPLTREPAAGPPGPLTEPATADAEMAGAELADAWAAHDRARTALATAAHATGPEGRTDTEAATEATQRQMEQAEERLWALGVPPEALADARTADARTAEMPVTAPGEQAPPTGESDLTPDEPTPAPGESAAAPGERAPAPGGSAPAVPLDAELRQWLADRLTEADLPPAPEAADGGETVTTADLRAAGITLSRGCTPRWPSSVTGSPRAGSARRTSRGYGSPARRHRRDGARARRRGHAPTLGRGLHRGQGRRPRGPGRHGDRPRLVGRRSPGAAAPAAPGPRRRPVRRGRLP